MSNQNEEANDNMIQDMEERVSQHLPPPPPGVGEGSLRRIDQLDILGQLLERVLANRSNVTNDTSTRSRISKAQRDFHQQKPPTFSGDDDSITADRWLSSIE